MRLLTLTLLVFAFYSFAPMDAKVFELNKWLPEGFDTRHTVLLVQNFKVGTTKFAQKACDKVNNELKEYMQATYHYKYEFADADAIAKDPKYADKEKYRYVLMDQNSTNTTVNVMSGHQSSMSSNVMHIYDRKADKHYPESSKSWSYLMPVFRPTVNAIVEYLKGLKG